jgi:hypothetical protein
MILISLRKKRQDGMFLPCYDTEEANPHERRYGDGDDDEEDDTSHRTLRWRGPETPVRWGYITSHLTTPMV